MLKKCWFPSYVVPMQDQQSQFMQRLVCGTLSSPWLIFTVCLLLAALAGMGYGGAVDDHRSWAVEDRETRGSTLGAVGP